EEGIRFFFDELAVADDVEVLFEQDLRDVVDEAFAVGAGDEEGEVGHGLVIGRWSLVSAMPRVPVAGFRVVLGLGRGYRFCVVLSLKRKVIKSLGVWGCGGCQSLLSVIGDWSLSLPQVR